MSNWSKDQLAWAMSAGPVDSMEAIDKMRRQFGDHVVGFSEADNIADAARLMARGGQVSVTNDGWVERYELTESGDVERIRYSASRGEEPEEAGEAACDIRLAAVLLGVRDSGLPCPIALADMLGSDSRMRDIFRDKGHGKDDEFREVVAKLLEEARERSLTRDTGSRLDLTEAGKVILDAFDRGYRRGQASVEKYNADPTGDAERVRYSQDGPPAGSQRVRGDTPVAPPQPQRRPVNRLDASIRHAERAIDHANRSGSASWR